MSANPGPELVIAASDNLAIAMSANSNPELSANPDPGQLKSDYLLVLRFSERKKDQTGILLVENPLNQETFKATAVGEAFLILKQEEFYPLKVQVLGGTYTAWENLVVLERDSVLKRKIKFEEEGLIAKRGKKTNDETLSTVLQQLEEKKISFEEIVFPPSSSSPVKMINLLVKLLYLSVSETKWTTHKAPFWSARFLDASHPQSKKGNKEIYLSVFHSSFLEQFERGRVYFLDGGVVPKVFGDNNKKTFNFWGTLKVHLCKQVKPFCQEDPCLLPLITLDPLTDPSFPLLSRINLRAFILEK
jgi:hypothetical protein